MSKTTRRLLLIVLLVMSACSWGAEFHVELGTGMARYSARSDGTWYQRGMPHRLDLNSGAYKFGLTGDAYAADDWGMAWHADVVDLGEIRSDCECTTIDALYNNKAHMLAHAAYTPIARFSGEGGARGVLLSLAPYARIGRWRIGGELGLFPYRPDWQVTVHDWHVSPNGPRMMAAVSTPRTWHLGGEAGAFVQRGRFTLAYQYYYLPTRYDETHAPAIWTGANVVMVAYEL